MVRTKSPQERATGREEPMHHAVYAAHLVRLTERWSVPRAVLLEGTGLSEAELDRADHYVPDHVVRRLIGRAIALTKEPGLGFHLGLHVKLSAHGAVGLAAMTSATFGDAVNVAERFLSLRGTQVELVQHHDATWTSLELVERFPLGELEPFVMESLLTGLAQIAELLLGEPLRARVEVRYPEPKHFARYAHLWPGPARFERPANRIVIPRALLSMPLSLADDFASREAIERCERELAALGHARSFASTVRRQLRRRGGGYLSLTELAERQGISPRTLKRGLAADGTSFQRLLDELRHHRAVELLEQPGMSVERVARDLGYSDTANFRRAFRRWTGAAPADLRKKPAPPEGGTDRPAESGGSPLPASRRSP